MTNPISGFPNADPLDGTELVPVVQFGIDTVTTIDDLGALLVDQMNANEVKKVVTATQSNSGAPTTPVAITSLTEVLDPGTYKIEGMLIWQAAATGTGIAFYINCVGGAVGRVMMDWFHVTTAISAATGVVDGTTTSSSQFLEGKAQRVNNTTSGVTAGVDTATSDVCGVVDATVVVTTQTTFQMMFVSSAASANEIQPGTHLIIKRLY